MDINTIMVVAMFVVFIGFLFMGIPVAYVLAGVGVWFAAIGYVSDLYFGTLTGLDFNTLGLVVNRVYQLMENWVLVALPMFIFMGIMLEKSGIAAHLMESMQALFGRVHGGLAITVMFIGILLAASTGIIGASVVLLGMLSLNPMLKQGYYPPMALGTVASAGTLGILVPPSIMLVIIGDQIGLSVGDLFLGAVLPGLILGLLYLGYILGYGYLKPHHAPLPANPIALDKAATVALIKALLPPIGLMLSVLGSIFMGIATPTEASGIGALGAVLLAAFYKKLNFETMQSVLLETYKTAGYIFAIFVGATCFSLVLRELGGDEVVENTLSNLELGGFGTIAFILFIIFLLGFVLDWIEITLIILPLVEPVISTLGIEVNGFGQVDHPTLLWFVILVAVTLQTSFLTPPVGFALFYLKGVCPENISLSQIYRGIVPFVMLQMIGLLIVALFPELVTWLPAVDYN